MVRAFELAVDGSGERPRELRVRDDGARERAQLDLVRRLGDELGDLRDDGRVPLAGARNSRDTALDPAERPRVVDLVLRQETCGSMRP
jgi:hypothetical protein